MGDRLDEGDDPELLEAEGEPEPELGLEVASIALAPWRWIGGAVFGKADWMDALTMGSSKRLVE